MLVVKSATTGADEGSSGSRGGGIRWRIVVAPVAGLMLVGAVLRLVGLGEKA